MWHYETDVLVVGYGGAGAAAALADMFEVVPHLLAKAKSV